METWRIVDADAVKAALEPPQRVGRDSVRSLRAKGRARSRVMRGGTWQDEAFPEPEPVDPDDIRHEWSAAAGRRWSRDRSERDVARDLAGKLRAA